MRLRHPGTRALLALACAAGLSLPADAADWSRFRGPNGAGVAPGAELPARFDLATDLAWKTPLPPGHSSPVLGETRIFLTGHEQGELFTIALDRATGEELWRREAPRSREEPFHRMNGPATPTPATDGENVYVFFGDFGLVSYDADGGERWRRPLGPFAVPNGHGSSPILADGRLVLQVDQDRDAFLMALDPGSGDTLWRTPRPEAVHGYSTPVVFAPEGEPVQIVATGSYLVASYLLETGEKRWWARGLTWQVKPSAAVAGDAIVVTGWAPGADAGERVVLPAFAEAIAAGDADADGRISEAEAVAGGWRHKGGWGLLDFDGDTLLDEREWEFFRARRSAHNATMAIRPAGRTGDVTDAAVLWSYEKAIPVVSSPLVWQGIAYTVKDGGILTALDAETGRVVKQARLGAAVDTYYASPIAAAGRIYILSERGTLSVVEAGRDWTLLWSGELGEPCYATPAVADDTLYVRTAEHLYAFGPAESQ
jgi:outer membrane protein assembly factor BamB